jgi:hypothetical protein
MAKTTYTIEDGQFFRKVEHNSGKTILYQICNFVAWITDEMIDDTGRRFFRIEGTDKNGEHLEGFWLKIYPAVYKPGIISQILVAWGTRAIVSPDANVSRHLKSAIQWYSLKKGTIRDNSKNNIKIW